ncbi:MAG: OmpA family protein [Flavobacteriaceae bacterium]|nr:OmpA family protein [Flavobacteriaceae bacterium]
MKNYTLLAILMCFSVIAKAQTSSGKHHIKYLDINSGNPDTGVSFITDDQVVFAATVSDRVINTQKYHPYLDFYTGTVGDDGAILGKKRLNAVKDRKVSKNAATFTRDGKTVYYSANKYSKRKSKTPVYQLFKATIDDAGNWQNIEKLPFNNRKYSYSYPAVNKDNSRLYFVSNAAPSRGGTDIFYVDIKEDGSYGDPVNLGDKINTSGNETTPFIADNNFLYFSSNGRADSKGGMDVYAVESFDNTFSDPLHLDSPINGINDDIAYIVNTENKGFFSSNRLQGRGNDDIYSFYIEPDKPIECLQEIVGTVRDKETEELITNAVITVVDEEGNEIKNLETDATGNYRFTLSCRNTFTVTATKIQYDKEEHIVNTANYFDAPPLEVNQLLEKQIKQVSEEKVVIKANPIYFGFDKYNITKEASKELDRIVEIMKENPTLIIEAASHTDARGPKTYNQKLSERRAKSTVNYIVSKGISKDRITAKGYGESQLINNCKDGVRCGIEKHKLNRRTEFVIVNKQALNLPKENKPITEKKKTVQTISTPKVTSAPAKSPVKEGASNDSSKGEIIFLSEEETKETEEAPNETEKQENDQPKNKVSSLQHLRETDKNDNSVAEEIEANLINKSMNPVVKMTRNKGIDNNIDANQDSSENALDNISLVKKEKAPEELSTAAPKVKGKRYGKALLVESTSKSIKKDIQPLSGRTEAVMVTDIDIEKIVPDKTREANAQKLAGTTARTTQNKDQKLTEKPTLESDFSVSEGGVNAKNIVLENQTIAYNQFNRDFTTEESNMSAVSNSLFSEEDDFESFDDKTVTSNRFASKVKRDKDLKTVSLAEQKAQLKKQFKESTAGLNKEEVLAINGIDVSPMAVKKNGKYVTTNTANRVDVMRINFQIDNNQKITPGYKEVFILIQNPQGKILNRKGKFQVNNGETLTYTEKTNAYYNNNYLNLSMMTDRFIQKIIKGTYTVTIYIEGYPVGLEMFTLS